MTVSSLKCFADAGYSVAQINQEYPTLTEDQIRDGIDFANSAAVAVEPDCEGTVLIEQCADFAAKHGIDHMLDVIAGVHQAYARLSNDPSIKAAYEIAGIDLDGALPLQ